MPARIGSILDEKNTIGLPLFPPSYQNSIILISQSNKASIFNIMSHRSELAAKNESDGTPCHISMPQQADDQTVEGVAGIKSNVRDLLTFHKTLTGAGSKNSTSSPLKETQTLMNPHNPLDPQPSASKPFYGLG